MGADKQKGDRIEVAGRRLVNSYGARFRVVPLGNLSLGQETTERKREKEANTQTHSTRSVHTHKQAQEKVNWLIQDSHKHIQQNPIVTYESLK